MITKRQNRKKVAPGTPTRPKDISDKDQRETFARLDKAKNLLRKKELSALHGIPENDIFVDPVNGVELYKSANGWVYSPEHWRGGDKE